MNRSSSIWSVLMMARGLPFFFFGEGFCSCFRLSPLKMLGEEMGDAANEETTPPPLLRLMGDNSMMPGFDDGDEVVLDGDDKEPIISFSGE